MAESQHVKRFRMVFAVLQLLLLVPGTFLLIVTLTLFANPTHFETIISPYAYFFSVYILVPISLLTLPLSILGIFVAVRHKIPALLSTLYIALLSLIFIGQLTGSCLSFLRYDTLRDQIGTNFASLVRVYNSDNGTRDSIDIAQAQLGCCGGVNISDWMDIFSNNTLPTSCCPSLPPNATCQLCPNTSTLATDSNSTISCLNSSLACGDAIANSVVAMTYTVGYIGFITLTIPGILIVISFCLININLSLD